jgi:G6PDH family F420-dependent oxidoreductase
MAQYGYTLFCEGTSPNDLVRQAVLAENAGFDFLVISDHYHPWLTNQEHSAFAWSVLGAVASATNHIQLATMVTCPIMRYHPAIIAQASATIAVLSNNRFTLGLGSGERLNEHIIGSGWPSVHVRQQMLDEAIRIIRMLHSGGYQSFEGDYFELDDARVFDLPDKPIPIFVAAGGTSAAGLAANYGGVCITEPKAAIVKRYTDEGGDPKTTWGQVVLSWDEDEHAAMQTAYDQFRFSAGGWKVQSELPNPINFDAATKNVRPVDLTENIPCGPNVALHQKAINKFTKAGINNLAVAYPGDNVEGFMKFWKTKLQPSLA